MPADGNGIADAGALFRRLPLAQKPLHPLGQDGAGTHAVAGDAVGPELLRDLKREGLHRALRRGVVGAGEEAAVPSRLGAEIDDAPVAGGPHVRQGRAGRANTAFQVEGQHALPVLLALRQKGRRRVQGAAGVVHQHRKTAARRDQRVDGRGDGLGIGHVHRAPGKGEIVRLGRALRLNQRARVAVPDLDMRALGGEPHGDPVTEPASGPGDERRLSLKAAHCRPPGDGWRRDRPGRR